MRKTVQLQVKSVGEKDGLQEGRFSAYASVFGVKDSYGDIVMPGAFTDTLTDWSARKASIPLLWGHRFDDPDFNIGHVSDAKEDDHGLLVTGELDLDSPKAAQVYRLLKGRRVDQMSFAYDVLEGGPATREGKDGEPEHYYELRKLRLYEVSVVPIGANPETEVLDVKTASAAAHHVLAEVKAGRTLSAKNEETLRTAYAAIGEVLDSVASGDPKNSQPAGLGSQEVANGHRPPADDTATGKAGPDQGSADEPAAESKAASRGSSADADLELQILMEGMRYEQAAQGA